MLRHCRKGKDHGEYRGDHVLHVPPVRPLARESAAQAFRQIEFANAAPAFGPRQAERRRRGIAALRSDAAATARSGHS